MEPPRGRERWGGGDGSGSAGGAAPRPYWMSRRPMPRAVRATTTGGVTAAATRASKEVEPTVTSAVAGAMADGRRAGGRADGRTGGGTCGRGRMTAQPSLANNAAGEGWCSRKHLFKYLKSVVTLQIFTYNEIIKLVRQFVTRFSPRLPPHTRLACPVVRKRRFKKSARNRLRVSREKCEPL